jgi:hypothetical protein
MTLKKKPPRGYETFPSSANSTQEPQEFPLSPKSSSTRSAGLEAQRLASSGLWIDNYINGTPPSSAATTMGAESEAYHSQQDDPSDPPPIYTPSETTVNSVPPSPTVARSEPVREPRSAAAGVQYPTIHEEDDGADAGRGSYASSPLLERADPGQTETRSRRCSRRSPEQKCSGKRRFKRACWFTCALVMCLWLMVPALMDNRVLRFSTLHIFPPHEVPH